jgi:hypothetical protein
MYDAQPTPLRGRKQPPQILGPLDWTRSVSVIADG